MPYAASSEGYSSDGIFVGCVAIPVLWMLKASSSSSASAFDRIGYIILVIGVMPLMTASALLSRIISKVELHFDRPVARLYFLFSLSLAFSIAAVLAMLAIPAFVSNELLFLPISRLCWSQRLCHSIGSKGLPGIG
jgi:uncharacterized membrane protein YidH (DUF202 family)